MLFLPRIKFWYIYNTLISTLAATSCTWNRIWRVHFNQKIRSHVTPFQYRTSSGIYNPLLSRLRFNRDDSLCWAPQKRTEITALLRLVTLVVIVPVWFPVSSYEDCVRHGHIELHQTEIASLTHLKLVFYSRKKSYEYWSQHKMFYFSMWQRSWWGTS